MRIFPGIIIIALAGFAVSSAQAGTVSKWLNDGFTGTNPKYIEDDTASNNDFRTYENTPFRPSLTNDTPLAYSGNNSMEFDGANGTAWVDGGINGTTLELRSSLTLEAWIKPGSMPSNGSPTWRILVGGLQNYGLFFDEVNQEFVFAFWKGSGSVTRTFTAAGTARLMDGNWHHIAATLDGSADVVKLYIDAVRDGLVRNAGGTNQLDYGLSGGTYDFYMGGDSAGRNFYGLVDEVRISDTALHPWELESYQAVDPTNGYELVWSDEFNGTSLDTNKWTAREGWRRNGYMLPDLAYVTNGNLVIETRYKTSPTGSNTCGWVDTYGNFEQEYGYFEVSAQLPVINEGGHWPGFWLFPESGITDYGMELDVFEYISSNLYQTVHFTGYQGNIQNNVGNVQTLGYEASFHLYGVEWTPDEIIWYIDNLEYFRVNKADYPDIVGQKPLSVLITEEIQTTTGDIDLEVLPDYFYIDYVRVYQPVVPSACMIMIQ